MLALLAALTQLHLTAVAFVPVAILALVAARRTLAWRHVALGLAAAGLLYAPYLAHEVTHRFENLRALVAGAGRRRDGEPGCLRRRPPERAPALPDRARGLLPGRANGGWAVAPLAGAVRSGGGPSLGRRRDRARPDPSGAGGASVRLGLAGRADAFLLLWPASPLLLLGTRGAPMWWYYFDPMYPSQFVLAGIALGALAGGTGARAGPAAGPGGRRDRSGGRDRPVPGGHGDRVPARGGAPGRARARRHPLSDQWGRVPVRTAGLAPARAPEPPDPHPARRLWHRGSRVRAAGPRRRPRPARGQRLPRALLERPGPGAPGGPARHPLPGREGRVSPREASTARAPAPAGRGRARTGSSSTGP